MRTWVFNYNPSCEKHFLDLFFRVIGKKKTSETTRSFAHPTSHWLVGARQSFQCNDWSKGSQGLTRPEYIHTVSAFSLKRGRAQDSQATFIQIFSLKHQFERRARGHCGWASSAACCVLKVKLAFIPAVDSMKNPVENLCAASRTHTVCVCGDDEFHVPLP